MDVEISDEIRAVLEAGGFLKPPTDPKPPVPKVDALLTKAQGKEWRVNLAMPAYAEDVTAVTVYGGGGTTSGEHGVPAVALAIALAAMIRRTEPEQMSFAEGQTADDE